MKRVIAQRRPAFTLVELLVVIAIIAVLAALIVGASMRVMGVQSQKNTELLVAKLGAALSQQWQAVVDQANNEPIPAAYRANILALAGNDEPRARVIWVKLRLKQQFPESFAEATNPAAGYIDPEPLYAAALAGPPAAPANVQNSVCLGLVFKSSMRGSTFEIDNLSPRETAMLSGTNLKYVIDDWKGVVQFRRFPYNDTDLNPGGAPVAGFNDPVDPTGKLSNGAWTGVSGAAYQGLLGHPVSADKSFKMIPYVWSTGGPPNVPVKSFKARIGGYNP